jgi:mxaJ protein
MTRLMRNAFCLAFLLVLPIEDGLASPVEQTVPPFASAKVLRVCADPAGLPYSNEKREGFENRVAEIVAKDLGATVEYTWWVQRRGFLRSTLNAGRCDVVMGAPIGLYMLRTTQPYYRSTFAFLTKRDRHLADLKSLGDARLRALEIGVPLAGDDGANPAPLHALGRRGITGRLHGFPLYGELGRDMPAAAEAVAKGEIDVAILWGPVAGFAAMKSREPLVVVPVAEEVDDAIPLTFAMGMGVRASDKELADKLDATLVRRRHEIAAILRGAGVPLLPLSTSRETRHAHP